MTVSDKNFETVMAGLGEVGRHMRGKDDLSSYRVHVPKHVDVKAIRKRVGLSQDAFAVRFGFSAAAVRDWEQGRRSPEASARVLLTVIDKEPDVVLRALAHSHTSDV